MFVPVIKPLDILSITPDKIISIHKETNYSRPPLLYRFSQQWSAQSTKKFM